MFGIDSKLNKGPDITVPKKKLGKKFFILQKLPFKKILPNRQDNFFYSVTNFICKFKINLADAVCE